MPPIVDAVQKVMERVIKRQSLYIAFLESQFSPAELEKLRDKWDAMEEAEVKKNG